MTQLPNGEPGLVHETEAELFVTVPAAGTGSGQVGMTSTRKLSKNTSGP